MRMDRREINNGLVLEGICPNRKQKAIAKRQSKSGEMRDGQDGLVLEESILIESKWPLPKAEVRVEI